MDATATVRQLTRRPGAEGGDRVGGSGPLRVMPVCSPGGHLLQMLALESSWAGHEATWVTYRSADVEPLLHGRQVVMAHGPTHRSLTKLLRNLAVAWRAIRATDPDVIVSTGAALAFPFFIVGRLLGRRLVYVESLARVDGISLTGRLVRPLADEFFVQWPHAARRGVRYAGSVL